MIPVVFQEYMVYLDFRKCIGLAVTQMLKAHGRYEEIHELWAARMEHTF